MYVYLIGAGPGDPGLITCKGLRALSEADVVVYDYLAGDALMAHARPDAERVYVGKVAGNHAMSQSDINRLLVDKARWWPGSKGAIPTFSAEAARKPKPWPTRACRSRKSPA